MKKLSSKYVVCILLATILSGPTAFASCDWSCDIRADYLCPTWREPLRICEGHATEPFCAANKLACRGALTACVTTALLAKGVTAECIVAVGGVYLSEGVTWETAVLICGLSAETIHEASHHCQ